MLSPCHPCHPVTPKNGLYMTSIIGVTHPKKSYVLVELTKIKKLNIRKLRKKIMGVTGVTALPKSYVIY